MSDRTADNTAAAIAADDPRRQALVELRARQLLIFALDDVDDGSDLSPLAEVLGAAFQELGPDADVELCRRMFTLVHLNIDPAGAATLVARLRAAIPNLLTKLEGTQAK
jgi:hypothetical protein